MGRFPTEGAKGLVSCGIAMMGKEEEEAAAETLTTRHRKEAEGGGGRGEVEGVPARARGPPHHLASTFSQI